MDTATATVTGTDSQNNESSTDTPASEKRKPEFDDQDSNKKLKQEEESSGDAASSGQREDSASESGKSSSQASKSDKYGYTQSGEFTSEVFKIKVSNLPKNFGFADIRSRFARVLGYKPHKIKSTQERDIAFICFKNEEERQRALEKINHHIWKGRHLRAERAAPAPDPYYKAREEADDDDRNFRKRKRGCRGGKNKQRRTQPSAPPDLQFMSKEEAEKSLKDSVIPLWNLDYDEQLEAKYNSCKDVLKKLVLNPFIRGLEAYRDRSKNDGMACPLLDVVPAPQTADYRNKNEYSIGVGPDGKTITIGFRYGTYKNGITTVGDGACLRIVVPHTERVAKSFEAFVRDSGLGVFQYHTSRGHWQTLMVRTFTTGDVMVMVDFLKGNLTHEKVEEVKQSIIKYYTEGEGKDIKITSFYLRLMPMKGLPIAEDKCLLFGEPYVYESVLGHKFRVSPEAFFQVNTPATEKLYGVVQDWSGVGENTVILDVCCGTGTIGLSLAKKVKEVIGIDNCVQAIEDARANAEFNGITNATYYCSKVEDVIAKIMTSFPSTPDKNLVAIVDPPRSGLNKNVVKCLRKHRGIQRLLFVSCMPEQCLDNFADLIRLPTNNLPGIPFTLVKAQPVDLFPGAKHCEMVLLFERDTTGEDKSEGK